MKLDVESHKNILDSTIENVERKHETCAKYFFKTNTILRELVEINEQLKINRDQCTNFTNINNLNVSNFENAVGETNLAIDEYKKVLDECQARVEELENTRSLKVIPHSINVASKLAKTSRLGEIEAIEVSAPYGKLADICGYTKANNGTTSGNPGGLLFRTMNPQGSLTNAMTLDANGKATIGNPTKNDRNPPAILALNSTTLGFLPPRMSTEEREHILNPVPGLVVFDTTSESLCFYKTSGWLCLS